MIRQLYETFDWLGVPYTIKEVTEYDQGFLPYRASECIAVGDSKIMVGYDEHEDDFIIGVLTETGDFIEGNPREC